MRIFVEPELRFHVDYNRHLEEVSNKVERILLTIIQRCFLNASDVKKTASLMKIWEQYRKIQHEDTEHVTMADETKLFTIKLSKVKEITETLMAHKFAKPNLEQLDNLQKRLTKLQANIETEGTLNAGGKFEWVDSILVKCLQDGCWLLLENVNLCSPAVLDRLNALLEPNGVLTIGERGVDENGEMINIVPHPNFRLFLTMDPKNGEISRAMRNRGIEIYMLNENESGLRNENDTKTLIEHNGLNVEGFQNILLCIHDYISEILLGEKPNISHILQASFLISQQLLRGINILEAFKSSIIDVYVNTKSTNDFNINDPILSIENYVVETVEEYLKDNIPCSNINNKTINAMNLQINSDLEIVKQQNVLLQEQNKNILPYIFLLSYDISSMTNLQMRHEYIKYVLSNMHDNKVYEEINNKVYLTLKEHFKRNTKIFNKDMPLDSLWLPDTKHKYTDLSESNQNFIHIYFMIIKILRESQSLNEPVEKKTTKLTIMQYSKAVHDKKLSQYSIEHPLILKFWHLISHFDEFLTSLLKAQTLNLNFEDTIIAMLALNWRIVLQDMGDVIVYDRSNKKLNLSDILSQLIVRYKWFIKNTVNYFLKLNRSNSEISMKLSNIINVINRSIENDFSNFTSISKRFVKQSSQPLPLINEDQISVLTKLDTLREKTSILVTKNNEMEPKYNLMLNQPQFNEKYIELRKEIRGGGVINTNYYEELVEMYNCSLGSSSARTELELLPIKDVIGMYVLSELRKCVFSIDDQSGVNEKCRILRKLKTIPPELNEILEAYFDTRDKRLLPELTLLKTMYLRNAICLHPSYCLHTLVDDENAKELTMHLPVLSFAVSNLCVALDGAKDLVGTVNLGTFKDKSQQLRYLNEVLWRSIPNFYSSSEYFKDNDADYIINSYNSFVKLIELSLTGQNCNSASISEVAQICINKINSIYSCNKESEEMMRNKDKTMSIFKELSHEAENLRTASTKTQKLICIGHVYCLLNYIKALFNSQLQVIDPLEKNMLKKKYAAEERNICSDLRDAFSVQNEIYSGNTRTLHPFCAILSANISNYLEKEAELEKLVAVRPKNISYQSLLREVHHDLNTLLSEDFFLKMYEKLKKSLCILQKGLATKFPVNLEECKDALKQSLSWLNSQNNSLIKLSKYRVGYPDIVEALLCNLTELSYGVKLLSSTLQKLIVKYEHLHEDLSAFVKNLIQFPVLNSSQKSVYELIELCTDLKNINVISSIISDDAMPNIAKQETLRLLKCSIQELHNMFVAHNPQHIETNNKNKLLAYLENLINLFVCAWHKQETERQKKLEEEQSIYKTKSKCDDLTEEQEDLQNMKLLFPNYHEIDFSDFQQKSLDEPTDNQTDSKETTEFVGVITIEDVKFVADIHSELMQHFTKSEWLNPNAKKQLAFDFVTPLLERYKLFTLMQNRLINGLDSDIEYDLIASLNVLVAVTKNYGEGEDIFAKINSSPRKLKEKCYDFYKDSKVEEVKSCLHVIEALKARNDELLNEWPGHPTLQSIQSVIERIYSFPITSAVCRFLTGFEILLSKCHEWEENAHSGVSLAEYLQSVTLQIIAWRKLELSGWKDCLTNCAQRMKNGVAKWWFHIYTTIQEFTNPDESGAKDPISALQLIKIFQEFIEKSPLGEYESRLELLFTFHCHTLHLPKTQRTDLVISILWNLHNFYCQFLSNVDAKIKNQRAPIEKKLKDFVKIARWNDINYWAVKETVEKTHKTLHKYIKEFEVVLNQSVAECLVNASSDAASSESVGIWDRPTRQNPREYHYTLDVSNYMASVKFKKLLNENLQTPTIPTTTTTTTESLLNKSEKYFTKSRNLCKETILATSYPTLIQNLDVFVADIIETSNHLRNLEVNTELEKPKQKSQAKSILQQKRKALADLFKALAKCGLSYKTGLIEAKLREDQSTEFLLKPIDLNASFGHIKTKGACDKQLLNVWDGCETYFMRTIARLSALESALKQPAKDLGFQNIERCKGFSAHLMVLAQDQKAKLIDSSRNLYYLRNYINLLTECGEEFQIIQTATITSISNLLTNSIIVMEQYKIILHACPEKPDFDSDVLDVPIAANASNEILIKFRNEAAWNSAFALIKNITSVAQKLKKTLDKLECVFPASEIQIEATDYLFVQDKVAIEQELNELAQKIKQLQESFGNKAVTNSLTWLQEEFEVNLNKLQTNQFNNEKSDISIEKYTKDVEKLMEHALVIIQNVYKKYDSLKSEAVAGEEEPERAELFDDNHLKTLVIENLFADLSSLEMKSIFRKVKRLLEKLYKFDDSAKIERCKTLLSTCVPLLEQLTLMYQYFVTQQISAYRVTCKLTSVLLNIFVELASKGFCVPEEFSDELNAEGQSTQQSSGMGLGEGEGEKDVSDRIESEDQLDDAQPAGQEKKNEDKDCKEEDKGIEMSEDFEGKLQDVDKNPDDESQSDDDSDAEKQMGDTEPESNRLDQQIWGSDEENEEDDDDEEAGEEQSGKQDKEEKGEGGELEDQQMAAKEEGSKPNEEEDETENKEKRKEEPQKDINEMDEPEFDEDQTDPYHGNQPPLPEPDPMDLPDDLQLDDGEEKEEQGEENPFDIDSMKEQMPPEEETAEDDGKNKDENKTEDDGANDADSSDEEDAQPNQMETELQNEAEDKEQEKEEEERKDTSGVHEKEEEKDKTPEKEEENEDTSALDNQQSKEDEIQPMDVDNIESADNVQTNPNKSKAENLDQISQEENNEKEGVGQTQMEEADAGHRGEVNAAKDSLSAQHEKEVPKEKRQRPGEADSERTLGETAEPIKKKLKTIDIQEANEDDDDKEEEGAEVDKEGKDAEMYQHIKEAKETDTQVMDAATKEQAETQKIQTLETEEEENKSEEPVTDVAEMEVDEPEPEPVDTPKQKSEQTEKKSKKADGKQQQGDIVEEIKDVEVEGDLVETMNVPRGTDSSYHTQYELFNENQIERLSVHQIQDLRSELESQLGTWKEPPPNREAEQTWEKFSAITSSLARDLSEQLRLVLEPTQASRLRGDFRTGRRINMRKVIPYIASQFRKDKIWLRRTKPSKRDYQIVLAIDDSSSMDDNHSKELAFESVALISKALTLLESGQLSVLSFGENTEILHKLTDTFTEKSGVKLLQKFQFQQKKTCVANLVDFVTTMFGDAHTSAPNAKLLIVVSDGRGIFSEGETFVQQAIRRAKFANIFMVFVIIDNPENKNSILDIRMPVFKDGQLLGIKSYLDNFPFPFYIILRDINTLPTVLSDALRQWFELVTNVEA